MNILRLLLIPVLLFSACTANKKQTEPLPDNSIFHLTSQWQNHRGENLQLKDLRGKTLAVVMIYTSCKTACPILVAKMKAIESKIDKSHLKDVSLVLVSIDPEVDNPEILGSFAANNGMDEPHWVFLTGDKEATQEFANVLSMKYKKISPIDFAHSNIISVFSPNGQLVSQEEGTEINVEKVVGILNKTVKQSWRSP